MQQCGRYHEGAMDLGTQQKITSLRSFRDAVLGELQPQAGGERYIVMHLRRLYNRLLREASQNNQCGRVLWEVPAYWEDKLRQLPHDQETVTDDEVANALLEWLLELLRAELDGTAA